MCRQVLDTSLSGATEATPKVERVMLPRILDVVFDLLELLYLAGHHEHVTLFLLDFAEAFWQVPLHPSERKYVSAKLGRHYLVWTGTAQGTRTSPLTRARVVALLMRITQGLMSAKTLRSSCFVDDPLMALRGTDVDINKNIVIIILTWSALGFRRSLPKGSIGSNMTWTSATQTVERGKLKYDHQIVATIKDPIMEDIIKLTNDFLRQNLVSKKSIRAYVGKLNHVASLIKELRPFHAELWTALTDSPTGSKAPMGYDLEETDAGSSSMDQGLLIWYSRDLDKDMFSGHILQAGTQVHSDHGWPPLGLWCCVAQGR